MSLSPDQISKILKSTQLAPSAHNTQPFEVTYFSNVFSFSLLKDRELPIADPQNHDLLLSLGTHIEGLSLALLNFSYEIKSIQKTENTYEVSIQKSTAPPSPLFNFVEKRKTYRGSYAKKPAQKISKTSLNLIKVTPL